MFSFRRTPSHCPWFIFEPERCPLTYSASTQLNVPTLKSTCLLSGPCIPMECREYVSMDYAQHTLDMLHLPYNLNCRGNIDFQHDSSTSFYLTVCHWQRLVLLGSSSHRKKTWSPTLSSPEDSIGSCCIPACSHITAPGCSGVYSWSNNPLHLHNQLDQREKRHRGSFQVEVHHTALCMVSPY